MKARHIFSLLVALYIVVLVVSCNEGAEAAGITISPAVSRVTVSRGLTVSHVYYRFGFNLVMKLAVLERRICDMGENKRHFQACSEKEFRSMPVGLHLYLPPLSERTLVNGVEPLNEEVIELAVTYVPRKDDGFDLKNAVPLGEITDPLNKKIAEGQSKIVELEKTSKGLLENNSILRKLAVKQRDLIKKLKENRRLDVSPEWVEPGSFHPVRVIKSNDTSTEGFFIQFMEIILVLVMQLVFVLAVIVIVGLCRWMQTKRRTKA